jgi:hypothetical protein
MTIDHADPVRCAAWTSNARVDPIGSTDGYDFFLVIEWPQPWPRDVGDIAELAPLQQLVAERGGRLQCVVPANDGRALRIALHRRSQIDGLVGSFRRHEVTTGRDDVPAAAAGLLDSGFEPGIAAAPLDVLICAHGRRDRCCGSLGTSLELSLRPQVDTMEVRTFRTSHLGGHRFAPNALVLPDASLWAFLDVATLGRIINRHGNVGELAQHYRGFAGLDHRPAQLLERQALIDVGWQWFDHHRSAHRTASGAWVLESLAPGGERHRWEGTVGVRRRVPVPECGAPITEATKTDVEFELLEVNRTT